MNPMTWRLRRAAVRLQNERIEIRQLLEAHGPGSYGALLMLLAAPCVLPVPGVGTVLGMGIAALAWAMWRQESFTTLPERVAGVSMPRPWARRVLAFLARVYGGAGLLARRRWPALAEGRAHRWVPVLVALMALLIVLPIPFGNVLPALSLLLLGVGLVFLDGLFVVLAAAAGGLAALFPIGLAVVAWGWGGDLLRWLA